MGNLPKLTETGLKAALFDLDGVITSTASVHFKAWKKLFDDVLRARAENTGAPFEPFTHHDYDAYVDGLPRLDGIRSFLAARNIDIPEGGPDDGEDATTIHGLARRKNGYFNASLEEDGVTVFPATRPFVAWLKTGGIAVAVVSSSKNCRTVLKVGGIDDLFETIVDGNYAAEHDLPGKPAPDTFLAAAELLGLPADKCAVFEDALAGVEAGRAGGFGLVVGVDQGNGPAALIEHGAHIVINDLGDLPRD